MASLNQIWWIVCEVWHYVIYGTSVYIFYTVNVPGINCLRLHCFSCMGFFNCSYRKSSFASQTQEKPSQIPIRGPNSFAFLNCGSIKSCWKKKMQPKTLSRTFPNFIHYNHGSGGKNHFPQPHIKRKKDKRKKLCLLRSSTHCAGSAQCYMIEAVQVSALGKGFIKTSTAGDMPCYTAIKWHVF